MIYQYAPPLKRFPRNTACLTLLALATPLSGLWSQNTWTGDNSALWDDDGNWSLNAIPVTDQDLVFDENGQVTTLQNDLGSSFQTGGILFGTDAPAYTLQGDSIRFTNTIQNDSGFLQTIDLDVIIDMNFPQDGIGGNRPATINTGAAGIALNGTLSSHSGNTDHNSDRLTKMGSGTLYLNNDANAFRGREAFIYEGDIQLGASHAMGNVTWAVNISEGAALTFASGVDDNTFYIPGLQTASNSSLVLEDTDNNPINLVLNRQVSRNTSITGGASGSGSLTIDTAVGSTHTISANGMTHTGGTFVLSGTLSQNADNAFGTGDIEIHGAGILRLASTNFSNSNDIYINEGTLLRRVHQNSMLNFGTDGQIFSLVTDGTATEVTVLAGTNNGSSGETYTEYSFIGSSAASNDALRRSDIFTIDNPGFERTFVLQLSTDSLSSESNLAIFNPILGEWVAAVDSNIRFGEPAVLAGYHEMSWADFLLENGSFNVSTMLGAHGFDAENNSVWAVLNYGANEIFDTDFGGTGVLNTANFSIIAVPEPATAATLGGLLALLLTVGIRPRRRV